MAVIIPNVVNWSVTPQNGQEDYFTKMNVWLSESTAVIATLNTAITKTNESNTEINNLATQTENNAIVATSLANYQGTWSVSVTYSKGQSVDNGSGLYYISKQNSNLNHVVTDTNYWLPNPINNKLDKITTNITVTVGSGGQFSTINQALGYLSGFYPMYKKSGITATINLKAGFVMAEQVLVSGIDLGWITITGEDSETILTHTALTTAFYGTYPAFGVDKGGTSPDIGQLFRFNVEKVGESKHGLMVYGVGSSADVLSGKGFIGAGTYGIYALDGSSINARGANCSNAGNSGIIAVDDSSINARSANCSNARISGIYVVEGSTVNAVGANCSNAGTYGINATQGSTVNAATSIIQNQTTGTARIRVSDGSHIEASGINTTGGTVTVFSQAVNTLTGEGIIYQ